MQVLDWEVDGLLFLGNMILSPLYTKNLQNVREA
jgi:hypothetical protein